MHELVTSAPAPTGEPAPVRDKPNRFKRLIPAVAVFLAVFVLMSLTAWDRVLAPSPHFHFVDLAFSLMRGEFRTETPRRYRNAAPRPDDPPGFQDAVNRHLTDGQGNAVGWNDWASYRVLRLKGGDVLAGVFPWKDDSGSKRFYFHTLDGRRFVIDPARDVARSCPGWPGNRCDRTVNFVSFPPFPAIAILPFAALWGYNFNDVLFTTALAGLNALLIFLLLEFLSRTGRSGRTQRENLWLTALFAFGTVHYFSAVRGEVWFTALIMGVALHCAFIYFALDGRRPLLAGIFLACGMATRTPLPFASLFFLLQVLFPNGDFRATPISVKIRKLAWFALPMAVALGLLMYYNWARFGDVLEFGHRFLVEGTRPSIREHGLFSGWFLPANMAACFSNVPVLTVTPPFVHVTRHGLSLLATTPAFLLLLWPKRRTPLTWMLWAAVAVIAIPALFYQNTGWAQFGYRFALDWMPYMILLLAVDGRPIGRKSAALILLSIAINLFGAITFGRVGAFYYD